MVEPGGPGAGRQRVAEQQATPAAQIEQVVTCLERQRVKDRAAREVVYVLGTVHLSRARPARRARHSVRQPVIERIVGEAADSPRRKVLVAEAEPAQRLHVTG